MRKLGAALAVASMGLAGAANAQTASAVDLTPLTGQVDGSVITTAILAVGGVLILPRLAKMAIRWVKGSVN